MSKKKPQSKPASRGTRAWVTREPAEFGATYSLWDRRPQLLPDLGWYRFSAGLCVWSQDDKIFGISLKPGQIQEVRIPKLIPVGEPKDA